MSAFIVKDETINRVVGWLVMAIRNDPYTAILKEKLASLGYDIEDQAFPQKLTQDMFELNISAVKQRYGKIGSIPEFVYTPGIPTTLIQILKSLNCWLYQCTEGDVPNRELFVFFRDAVEKFLLRKIVYELPENDRAEWG